MMIRICRTNIIHKHYYETWVTKIKSVCNHRNRSYHKQLYLTTKTNLILEFDDGGTCSTFVNDTRNHQIVIWNICCPNSMVYYIYLCLNSIFFLRFFSSKSLKRSLFPVIWNEEPLSWYDMLLIIVLSMHAMRVKSSSNCEAIASLAVATAESFLLASFMDISWHSARTHDSEKNLMLDKYIFFPSSPWDFFPLDLFSFFY